MLDQSKGTAAARTALNRPQSGISMVNKIVGTTEAKKLDVKLSVARHQLNQSADGVQSDAAEAKESPLEQTKRTEPEILLKAHEPPMLQKTPAHASKLVDARHVQWRRPTTAKARGYPNLWSRGPGSLAVNRGDARGEYASQM